MRNTALFFSYLFHPIFLPTAGLLLIFSLNTYMTQTMPEEKQFFIVAWIFINTAVIPLLFTLFLRWKKMVQSVQLHTRKDRIIPFAFAVFLYFTNYYLMKEVPLPTVIYSLFLGSSVAVALSLVITLFTKISIHMIGMGGLTASIAAIAQLYDLPVIGMVMLGLIASGLVGSARYILDSHNLRQIYMGWALGFFTIYLPIINSWG